MFNGFLFVYQRVITSAPQESRAQAGQRPGYFGQAPLDNASFTYIPQTVVSQLLPLEYRLAIGELWLHEGCDSDLPVHFRNFGAIDFPFKNPFKKCFKIVFFSVWRRDPVLELQFPTLLRVVLLCFATQSLQIAL